MIALIASIFALGIGPLVYQTFGPMKRTDRLVSGFILVVITGTLLTDTLPHTYENVGFIAIVFAVIGFIGPTLIEKAFRRSANNTHIATIALGIFGLIIHASFDGAALSSNLGAGLDGATLDNHSDNLSLAIILHRLPVGLTIWWLLKPLIGEKLSLLTLIAMAVATAGGFSLSIGIVELHNNHSMSLFQAFISGSLLHVILHKPHDDGCMHTGHTHNHSHAHSHADKIVTDSQIVKSKIDYRQSYAQIPSHHESNPSNSLWQTLKKWEYLGMLLGLLILYILH